MIYGFFFFNKTAPTEIYTLSLPDALPISGEDEGDGPLDPRQAELLRLATAADIQRRAAREPGSVPGRSEEHTSELQSRQYLVCRLLLEKKNKDNRQDRNSTRLNSSHANTP